jgi:curved DNA-binding protein CbpA
MSGEKKPSLINPFELLGFDVKKPNINLKELKKNYYNLALMCHPDKGGDKHDMIILQTAYEYVKTQIELSEEKSHDFEETVNEFETFMKDQTKDPLPFSKVYEEAHVWLQEFNQKFQDNIQQEKENDNEFKYFYDPFQDGYGSFMDKSEYINENEINAKKYTQNFKEFNKPTQHQFDWELTDASDYSVCPSVINKNSFYELKTKTIDDFTTVGMSDYRLAFTPANIKDTKTTKIEKPKATEVENKLEKLKNDRYLLDSELDDRVIDQSFIMLKEEDIVSIPIEYINNNNNNGSKYKKRKWF